MIIFYFVVLFLNIFLRIKLKLVKARRNFGSIFDFSIVSIINLIIFHNIGNGEKKKKKTAIENLKKFNLEKF